MGGGDYEHWPADHEDLHVYRPAPSRRHSEEYKHWPSRNQEDQELYVYRPSGTRRAAKEYEHWPIDSKSLASYRTPSNRHSDEYLYRPRAARKDFEDDDDQGYLEISLEPKRPRRRRSPSPQYYLVTEESPVLVELEGDTELYCYKPDKYKSRKKSPIREADSNVWMGRSREQVKRDDARIANKEPQVFCKNPGDLVWVEKPNGSLVLRQHRDVKKLRGKWKAHHKDPDSPYFVMD